MAVRLGLLRQRPATRRGSPVAAASRPDLPPADAGSRKGRDRPWIPTSRRRQAIFLAALAAAVLLAAASGASRLRLSCGSQPRQLLFRLLLRLRRCDPRHDALRRGDGRGGTGGAPLPSGDDNAPAAAVPRPPVLPRMPRQNGAYGSSPPSSAPSPRVLTIYAESPTTLRDEERPLPPRKSRASSLVRHEFPHFRDCSHACARGGGGGGGGGEGAGQEASVVLPPPLPIDGFPEDDPHLPWLHDYFVRDNRVAFVAQNRRRCETGQGKEGIMRYWEPQIALFQPASIRGIPNNNGSSSTSFALSSPEDAEYPETRFFCRFDDGSAAAAVTTVSTYPFNYEYVAWRKRGGRPMFRRNGRDVEQFEFSQLLFSCPIPPQFLKRLTPNNATTGTCTAPHPPPPLWLELVPIRTPAREQFLLTRNQVGPLGWDSLNRFDAGVAYGNKHVLPPFEDSGRWSNLPLCPGQVSGESEAAKAKTHQNNLVVCTWTAATYRRRGDVSTVSDSADRLLEWIVYHRMVGVDRIYLYDNTPLDPQHPPDGNASSSSPPLRAISMQFPDFVTYVPWPAASCSNNRPNHQNPGERSSQYAAEASCRERFGPRTEWMAFLDTDEYLVPLQGTNWTPLLARKKAEGKHVLKLRSSRGKPRINLMDSLPTSAAKECANPFHRRTNLPEGPCLGPRRNETYLKVYNCNYIKPPIPDRFARAMKQIYRPAFVLSHFVHYSTITADIARYYEDWPDPRRYTQRVQDDEWGDEFLDDLTEGMLVHTKSILPHETLTSNATCQLGSKHQCLLGYVCPESTPFVDEDHQKNVFQDAAGNFCNCWVQEHVEQVLVPLLESQLHRLRAEYFGGA